jgi:hypothetical protein
MEPTSSSGARNNSLELTPEEIEARASLPRESEPERLESRAEDAPRPPPPAPPPAVQTLIDKHGGAPHGAVAFSVGVNAAVGLGVALGGELSAGMVIDMADPKISLFISSASGLAAATGVSAGVSAQVSAVKDLDRFWDSGAEHALNVPGGGVALNYSVDPSGERQLNGVTESLGPSIGADAHYYEGTTERFSLSWQDIKDAVERAAGLPGPHRYGP